MQQNVPSTIQVLQWKEMLFILLLILVGSFSGCSQTKQPQENLGDSHMSEKKVLEYKGWKIKLLAVETSGDKLIINDLPLVIGSSEAPKPETEYVKPKGVFLLVTLSLEKLDGETLPLQKSLIIDDKGRQIPALAVGGEAEHKVFMFIKGMQGPTNSATCQLAFDVPVESTKFRLKLMGDSAEMNLPKAEVKQSH